LAAVPYSEAARTKKAEGRIFVQFKVTSEGKVEYVTALRPGEDNDRRKSSSVKSAIADPLLVKAAEQAVAAMPAWTPAESNGIPVVSSHTVPVDFFLTSPTPAPPVYAYADQMPVFKGAADDEQFVANVQRSIRYPVDALRNRKGGVALAYYEVDEQGQISPVKIIHPVYPAIDEEVARVIGEQRVVKPAMHQGKPVKVLYIIPITFAIL
jgi:outer membrane biosynthesis protein TonB